jgi:hypothetical protein
MRVQFVASFVLLILLQGSASRAALLFSKGTDTISVSGNTVQTAQATYEATILLNSTTYVGGIHNGAGVIFNAWQIANEDEALAVENGGLGYANVYPVDFPQSIAGGSMSIGNWYDLAVVYDGSQERLYINGTQVASQAAHGTVGSGSSIIAAVGAINRELFCPSFLGEIQSLRISNVARYSGSTYTPVLADFSNDASTELLYNFDTAPVGGQVTDLSGNGHTGTLGVGFSNATSPTFIALPEPSGIVFACACGASLLLRRRRPI